MTMHVTYIASGIKKHQAAQNNGMPQQKPRRSWFAAGNPGEKRRAAVRFRGKRRPGQNAGPS